MKTYLISAIGAFCTMILLLVIFLFQNPSSTSFFATHPREWNQFFTAFTGSWLHGDVSHLSGNLISLAGLFALYILLFPGKWFIFFILQFITSGIILFFLSPEGISHIGASTWAYSYVGFLSLITLMHPNARVKSYFLLVCLWYGGMWWGLLPLIPGISYHGHISGLIAGVLIALLFQGSWFKYLPNIVAPSWSNEDELKESNPYDNFK